MTFEQPQREAAPVPYSALLAHEMRAAFQEFERTMHELQSLFTTYLESAPPCAAETSDEHCLLAHAKRFLREERTTITQITKGTVLANFDCVSQAVMACFFLAARGHEVTIVRPKQLQRYFHALILEKDGTHFQIAGQNRQYEVVPLKPAELVGRLRIVKAAMETGIPQTLHEHKKRRRKIGTAS